MERQEVKVGARVRLGELVPYSGWVGTVVVDNGPHAMTPYGVDLPFNGGGDMNTLTVWCRRTDLEVVEEDESATNPLSEFIRDQLSGAFDLDRSVFHVINWCDRMDPGPGKGAPISYEADDVRRMIGEAWSDHEDYQPEWRTIENGGTR